MPLNFPRVVTVDSVCGGHKIPANTLVITMSHTVMSTDAVFEKPDVFRPERYLEADGKTLRKELIERTIPFGMGKRICAGESLARMEIFMGLVAIVQNFRITKPKDAPLETTPIFGGVLQPPPNNFDVEVM